MYKTGNLFNLAEKQLLKEKKLGIIPCYTELDVIEYAVKIRRFLDHNPSSRIKKIIKLTKIDLKRKAKLTRRTRYLLYEAKK